MTSKDRQSPRLLQVGEALDLPNLKAYNGIVMERSRDWRDQAQGDLDHTGHDLEHCLGRYPAAYEHSRELLDKMIKDGVVLLTK